MTMIESPHAMELRAVADAERIVAIDVIRGLALLGILLANMQSFAMPFAYFAGGQDVASLPVADRVARFFIAAFCEYKFITTFSLLFGAGLTIQFTRARQAGRDFAGLASRRLIALTVIGFLHATLLWYGDILFVYGIAGFAMIFAARLRPRTLLILAAVFLGVSFLAGSAVHLAQYTGALGSASQPEVNESLRGWGAIEASGYDPMSDGFRHAETIAYAHGPWTDAITFRLYIWAVIVVTAVFSYGWHLLSMFMIGATLVKTGFFGVDRRGLQLRVGLVGLILGWAVEIPFAVMQVSPDPNELVLAILGIARELTSVSTCLGYVGLLAWAVNSSPGNSIFRMIARTGRMALTVYLSETVISTFLMYWWGLGWFNEVSRAEQVGLAVAIYLGLTIFANLWMIPFRMGPMEWLWRCATYLKPQPLLRAQKVETPP